MAADPLHFFYVAPGESRRLRLGRALWRFWDAALGRLPGRSTHPNWRRPFWSRHLTNALKISSGNVYVERRQGVLTRHMFDQMVQDMRWPTLCATTAPSS